MTNGLIRLRAPSTWADDGLETGTRSATCVGAGEVRVLGAHHLRVLGRTACIDVGFVFDRPRPELTRVEEELGAVDLPRYATFTG